MPESLKRRIMRAVRDLPEEDMYKHLWFSIRIYKNNYSILLNSGLTSRTFEMFDFMTKLNFPTVVLSLRQQQLPDEMIHKIVFFYMRTEEITRSAHKLLNLYNQVLYQIESNAIN